MGEGRRLSSLVVVVVLDDDSKTERRIKEKRLTGGSFLLLCRSISLWNCNCFGMRPKQFCGSFFFLPSSWWEDVVTDDRDVFSFFGMQ